MAAPDTLCPIEELANTSLDVLIVGSGAAGVAVAERIFRRKLAIAVVERGSILTLTHVNNIFPNEERRRFIERFKINPWEGSFQNGGMLIPALGGRGIAAGAHLRRFDARDFKTWANGAWPDEVIQALPIHYREAEIARRVSVSAISGPAQAWSLGTLEAFGAHPPTIGVDLWSGGGFESGRGYDSSVARLWKLVLEDMLSHQHRLYVTTNAYAFQIEHDGSHAHGVWCIDASSDRRPKFLIRAKTIVLAASTVESARLLLLSGVDAQLPAVGCYLAEHIERRAKISVPLPTAEVRSDGVSLIVPPTGIEPLDRFQIHLRGKPVDAGYLEIDIGGFAAMDPAEDNRVSLSQNVDEYGVRKAVTHAVLSAADEARARRMCARMAEIVASLDGNFITAQFSREAVEPQYADDSGHIQKMELGRSYHEAGTLRMGSDCRDSVTDSFGRVHGMSNLCVADASLFPCVGVANPMLTITALAYRVADAITP
jgi:choline dehydrogenase-like flavoprotein